MKKNVMMRVASIMLVLVLMSSSVISGTFAKYVTKGQSTDSARVAKFGVTVTGTATIFSDSYKDVATTYNAGETGDAITVQASSAGTKVVAPGTQGDLADFTVNGNPEVDVRVSYDAELEIGDKWMVDDTLSFGTTGWTADTYYCPIIITVNGTDYAGTNYPTAEAFEAAVEAAIEACAKDYDANKLTADAVKTDLNVSWRWPFYVSDDLDHWDTQLGDIAAADVTNAGVIDLTIDCFVTQID